MVPRAREVRSMTGAIDWVCEQSTRIWRYGFTPNFVRKSDSIFSQAPAMNLAVSGAFDLRPCSSQQSLIALRA